MEKSFEVLKFENEQLREHTRKVEQKNDDLERANRVVSATVTDLEAMLNQAYEKNEFLELEVEDKESLSVKHQRVLDELRGEWNSLCATSIEKYRSLIANALSSRSETRIECEASKNFEKSRNT